MKKSKEIPGGWVGGSNAKVSSLWGYGYFLEVNNNVVKNPKHLAPGLREYAR